MHEEGRADWLRRKNIAVLFDSALADLLESRPCNVEGFLAGWFADREQGAMRHPASVSSPGALAADVVADSIDILHFNDVYNIEPQKFGGGGARLVALCRKLRQDARAQGKGQPLVLFSGDAFNPSLMSTVTKGKQMVPVLNNAEVDCAVYGNHDFDFGVETLQHLAHQCRFPWLMSNAFSRSTGRPLANGAVTHVVDVEGTGRRVGFIGLVEKEWMATLATVDEHDVIFEDFCACAHRLAPQLRAQGCDAIVALTHMRVPNDRRLAVECGDVLDLILGGHDHHYEVGPVGPHGVYVCKSGTDFRECTQLTLEFPASGRPRAVNVERVELTADLPEDPETTELVREWSSVVSGKMDQVIGETSVELESRFHCIRTQETNVANFIADVMRRASGADIALLNAGTIRADKVFPPGSLKVGDLVSLLPMLDELCVLKLTGAHVLQALENGVSQYPRLEGRFPCLSGVRLAFDASKPAGERVVAGSVTVGLRDLCLTDEYTLVTKDYLGLLGKDGYQVFLQAEPLPTSLPHLSALLRDQFTDMQVARGQKAGRRRCSLWRPSEAVQQHMSSSGASVAPQVDGRIECRNGGS